LPLVALKALLSHARPTVLMALAAAAAGPIVGTMGRSDRMR
jgi:hypothetical protein